MAAGGTQYDDTSDEEQQRRSVLNAATLDSKLSPLEMLERRMAGTLLSERFGQEAPAHGGGEGGGGGGGGGPVRPRVDTSISTSPADEWVPRRRDSVSSLASTASTSSGILDSFRLSTLQLDAAPQPQLSQRGPVPNRGPPVNRGPAPDRGPVPNRGPMSGRPGQAAGLPTAQGVAQNTRPAGSSSPGRFYDAVLGGGTQRPTASAATAGSSPQPGNISRQNSSASNSSTASTSSVSPVSPIGGASGPGFWNTNPKPHHHHHHHQQQPQQQHQHARTPSHESIGSPATKRVGSGSSSGGGSPRIGFAMSPGKAAGATNNRHSVGRDDWKTSLPVVDARRFQQMTTEEHVAAGIRHHEHGDLRQASYHWQHAAFKGDPTGMLLYGLALRHGWGVRQNPEEAIRWLRRAMESTVSADGSLLQEYRDNKTKRAQAGLAFYELGMSYLHSWGTDKNEAMALKSFEMAAELDDVDGLCEAAALYMHSGKGRKKDLMRAAALYRRAGELGASMVGQSWIYKDKYVNPKKGKK